MTIFDMKPRDPQIRWPAIYRDIERLFDAIMTIDDGNEDGDGS